MYQVKDGFDSLSQKKFTFHIDYHNAKARK